MEVQCFAATFLRILTIEHKNSLPVGLSIGAAQLESEITSTRCTHTPAELIKVAKTNRK